MAALRRLLTLRESRRGRHRWVHSFGTMIKRLSSTRSEAVTHHFVGPFNDGEYVLLLVISDPAVSPNAQRDISCAIVRTGCRYALAFGVACSTWDDSIDLASIEAQVPDDRFIMTTWHEKEPIEDVVDFWWWKTLSAVRSKFLSATSCIESERGRPGPQPARFRYKCGPSLPRSVRSTLPSRHLPTETQWPPLAFVPS